MECKLVIFLLKKLADEVIPAINGYYEEIKLVEKF